jgi:hypothetical protein
MTRISSRKHVIPPIRRVARRICERVLERGLVDEQQGPEQGCQIVTGWPEAPSGRPQGRAR